MSEKTNSKKASSTTSKNEELTTEELVKQLKNSAKKKSTSAKKTTAKTTKEKAVTKTTTTAKKSTKKPTTETKTKTETKSATKIATKPKTKTETKSETKITNDDTKFVSVSLVPSTNIPRYVVKPNEEYMNENQKNHFRAILNFQKNNLSSDIQHTMSSMQDSQTIYADPNDRASQETDMAIELRNRDRERKLIKKIDETLAAINRDDYGYCEECGEEIGISRLEARPTARLCIECKHLAELRERQMGK